MKKTGLFILLILISALLSSCMPAESVHPLSEFNASLLDPNLEGVWVDHGQSDGDEKSYLHFNAKDDGKIQLMWVFNSDEGIHETTFEGYVTKLDDKNYLNLKRIYQMSENEIDGWYQEMQYVSIKRYIICQYELDENGILTFWYLDDDKVEDAIQEGLIQGEVKEGDDANKIVIIQDSQKNLVHFVKKTDFDDIFQSFGSFRRLD